MLRQTISMLALAATLALPIAAHAGSTNDAVSDAFGGRVIDARGNCVRTKWDNPNDVCGATAPKIEKVETVQKKVVVEAPTKELRKGDLTVYFDFDKSNLTGESTGKLDRLADLLKQDVTVKGAKIVGYTDSIGKDSYNQKLSEKRAKVVEDYIHKRGYLGETTPEVRAFGPQNPVANCDGIKKRKELIECKAPDRRVEIEIQYVQ